MCVSCGCDQPTSHGDPRNITLNDLMDAADAAGVGVGDVAVNISRAVDNPPPGAVFAERFNRPVVICDIDGVLSRWADAANTAVNAEFGTSYTYQMWTAYPGPFRKKERAFLDDLMADTPFWAAIAPDTAGVEGLKRVAETNIVVIGSQRPRTLQPVTTAWLEQCGVPYNGIELVGPGNKPELVAAYAAGPTGVVLIDDDPARWVDVGTWPTVTLISPRRPWTPNPLGYRVAVTDTWEETLSVIAACPAPEPRASLH